MYRCSTGNGKYILFKTGLSDDAEVNTITANYKNYNYTKDLTKAMPANEFNTV